jgi:hypothetical protein
MHSIYSFLYACGRPTIHLSLQNGLENGISAFYSVLRHIGVHYMRRHNSNLILARSVVQAIITADSGCTETTTVQVTYLRSISAFVRASHVPCVWNSCMS